MSVLSVFIFISCLLLRYKPVSSGYSLADDGPPLPARSRRYKVPRLPLPCRQGRRRYRPTSAGCSRAMRLKTLSAVSMSAAVIP